MKKPLTGALALVIAAFVSIPAVAADNAAVNDGTKSTAVDVNGIYMAGEQSPDTVAVDITWDEMKFGFKEGEKTWNPDTHTIERENGTWSGGEKAINVVNHSNVEVTASFNFEPLVGLIWKFSDDKVTLPTVKDTDSADVPAEAVHFTVTDGAVYGNNKIGTITVTVKNDVKRVSTEEELLAALETAASIKLTKDITLSEELRYDADNHINNCVIDLNGHTVSSAVSDSVIKVQYDSVLTLMNGTVEATQAYGKAVGVFGSAKFINCTLKTVNTYALNVPGGKAVLDNCTVNSGSHPHAVTLRYTNAPGSLTLGGTTTLIAPDRVYSGTPDIDQDSLCKTVCLEGIYNFDPSKYTDTSVYTVTENTENGTWTVEKH